VWTLAFGQHEDLVRQREPRPSVASKIPVSQTAATRNLLWNIPATIHERYWLTQKALAYTDLTAE
jgi:hypothetical protein